MKMELILLVSGFAASCLFCLIVFILVFNKKLNLQDRLEHIKETYENNTELQDVRKLPFRDRVIIPLNRSINRFLHRITPKGMQQDLERKLRLAGYPFGITVGGWVLFRWLLTLGLPVLLFPLLLNGEGALGTKVLLFAALIILCIMLPNIILNRRTRQRSKKMTNQLPDILDLLVVSVEAGLSFDGALEKVAEMSKGELTKEFVSTINEIQLGIPRRDALTNMSKRCEIADISVFLSSVIQAEQLGVSLGKVLRIQAVQVRDKRRQRARESAMKIPIKIIVPLVIFIFPTIFVVILGPAVLRIMEMFK
jgi:tight adherence protein C